MNLIGKYIKSQRLQKELSLRGFCREIGYDAANWSKVERGELACPDDKEVLGKIAELLKVNRLWISFLAKVSRGEMPEYSEKELVAKLPLFLPDGLGEEALNNLVKLLKEK